MSSSVASPSGVCLELAEEDRHLFHVIGVDFRQLGEFFRIVIVMGNRMMPLRNSGLRITPSAFFTADHQRGHARNVGLKRQYLQIEHQVDMVFEVVGDSERPRAGRPERGGFGIVRLNSLQPYFNFTNRSRNTGPLSAGRPVRECFAAASWTR